MKLLIPFLLTTSSLLAQNGCQDLLALIGQRDIYRTLTDFRENCGPFEETISEDGTDKKWRNEEKGIEITFINRASDKFALPKYEVMMVELTAFTDKGGYKQAWPFGFTLGMDHKMVKQHIEDLKSVTYNKKDLGKTGSSFVYTGSPNANLGGRQIKVSIVQFDGKTISSMRLRLK
ncbi:MAG: hypothetical protein GC178_16095 [Flavobacteriales bacterium]|nr:hypothetical protein [Flavobacteriales bacterium]